jgi:hypothetical protein
MTRPLSPVKNVIASAAQASLLSASRHGPLDREKEGCAYEGVSLPSWRAVQTELVPVRLSS